MTIKTALGRSFVLGIALAAANFVFATPQLTFTDTWKDTGANDAVTTTGSATVSISLPLNGVDLSEADAGSQFSLAIGPSGSTAQIISDTLGDATSFSASRKTATFTMTDPNSLASIGSLTVSWTATTLTVTGHVSEDILGEEQSFSGASSDMPTNYSLSTSSTGVYYEVSVGLDASDNGGGTYTYDNAHVPVTGTDSETEYNPTDGTDPYPLEKGSITGTGNFTPPKLTVSPATNFKVYDANTVIDLTGMASDGGGITNIECVVNGDTNGPIFIDQESSLPTNEISWTIELDLSTNGQVGSNLVTVIAQDFSGNQTSVSRTFLWIETNSAALAVFPANAGTIKGLKNGQSMLVGNSYPVTATPASKAWVFSQWTNISGETLSSSESFRYLDTDGTLTAVFVPNPFTDLAGTYTGLYFDTNDEEVVRDDGYITVTVTATGAFTGKIYNADYSKTTGTLTGQLSVTPDGSMATAAAPLVLFGTHDYLQVNLQISTDPVLTDPGAGLMTGIVNSYDSKAATDPTDTAEIMGELSYYNTNVLPGLYNFVIAPAASDPSQGPGGYSYGTATVSKKGAVAVVLNLADGVSPAISFSSALAQDGSCPIYAALYGGNAVFLGWLQFDPGGSGAVSSSSIIWFTESYDPTLLPRSTVFSAQPNLSGGLYVPPKAGTNVFGATSLTFTVDPAYSGLSLPDEQDRAVTYNPVNNTFTDAEKVPITLTPSTGAMKSTFPEHKTSVTFKGVEVDGMAYGFYIYTPNKETGPVTIGPAAQSAAVGGDSGGLIITTGDSSSENFSSGAIDTEIQISVPPMFAPTNSP